MVLPVENVGSKIRILVLAGILSEGWGSIFDKS